MNFLFTTIPVSRGERWEKEQKPRGEENGITAQPEAATVGGENQSRAEKEEDQTRKENFFRIIVVMMIEEK